MIGWLREPQNRLRGALFLLGLTLVGWPMTHVLLLVLHPAGASGWVFHLLLALSWLSLTLTSVNIVATTDVRKQEG